MPVKRKWKPTDDGAILVELIKRRKIDPEEHTKERIAKYFQEYGELFPDIVEEQFISNFKRTCGQWLLATKQEGARARGNEPDLTKANYDEDDEDDEDYEDEDEENDDKSTEEDEGKEMTHRSPPVHFKSPKRASPLLRAAQPVVPRFAGLTISDENDGVFVVGNFPGFVTKFTETVAGAIVDFVAVDILAFAGAAVHELDRLRDTLGHYDFQVSDDGRSVLIYFYCPNILFDASWVSDTPSQYDMNSTRVIALLKATRDFQSRFPNGRPFTTVQVRLPEPIEKNSRWKGITSFTYDDGLDGVGNPNIAHVNFVSFEFATIKQLVDPTPRMASTSHRR